MGRWLHYTLHASPWPGHALQTGFPLGKNQGMPGHLTIGELPARYQAEAYRQLGKMKVSRQDAKEGRKERNSGGIRQKRSQTLNKLESAFWERLKGTYGAERVLSQAITLQIANGTTFRPDFMVVQHVDGSDLHSLMAFEVKGPHAWDDAIVKLKVAARMYDWISFYIVRRDPEGRWVQTRILP